MKHCAPNHLLVCKDGALLAILFIILNQLTKYEAPICNNFRDILFTSFQWLNLQRAIITKNIFLKFHQVINWSSYISWPSLKLPGVTVFKISLLQVFNAEICKGQLFFFKFSPGNLLNTGIFYQLTKFEAPSCKSFWNILITKFLIFNTCFQCPNLQRAITRNKSNNSFF